MSSHTHLHQTKRTAAVDGLRGWLLIMIAINHIGSVVLTPFTRETFGYVSAAEAFIFLSGIVAAQVYGRYVEQPNELLHKIGRRVAALYLYTFSGVVVVTLCLQFNLLNDYWYKDQDGYFALYNYLYFPAETLLLSALQINQMAYFDILVNYILPMMFLPWALRGLAKGYSVLIISISLSIWLVSQFSSDELIRSFYHQINPMMKTDAGYMDFFAWQLLFYTGVVLSFHYQRGHLRWVLNTTLFYVVLAVSILLMVAHHLKLQQDLTSPTLLALFSWKDLGLVRYLNTLLLGLLLTHVIAKKLWLIHFLECRPAIFLGQHSLQVFIFHSVAIFFFLPYAHTIQQTQIHWQDVLITATFIGSLFIPAWIHYRYKKWAIKPNR
jgi:hypothetical protein